MTREPGAPGSTDGGLPSRRSVCAVSSGVGYDRASVLSVVRKAPAGEPSCRRRYSGAP